MKQVISAVNAIVIKVMYYLVCRERSELGLAIAGLSYSRASQ